jgi:hypothetical protein
MASCLVSIPQEVEVDWHASVFGLVEAFEAADHPARHDFVNKFVASISALPMDAAKARCQWFWSPIVFYCVCLSFLADAV